MKQDKNAVSFLIIYIFLFIGVIGLLFMFLSDITDVFVPIYNTNIAGHNDATTQWGYDALTFLGKFMIVFSLIGLILFSYTMAQKPEKRW